jgi:hypothetical protein
MGYPGQRERASGRSGNLARVENQPVDFQDLIVSLTLDLSVHLT